MKIKNSELEKYLVTINKLAESTNIGNVSVQYSIYKLSKVLLAEYNNYIEFRKKIEAKYFVIENGIVVMEEESNRPVFQEGKQMVDYVNELTELFEEEVDVPVNFTITMEDLDKAANAGEIAPKDFAILEKFFPPEVVS